MTGWHELPQASVPPFAARVVLAQAPDLLRRLREAELLWRGQGRPDLADQLVMGQAQLKRAARAWEDATGAPSVLDAAFAIESGQAKAPVEEGRSAGSDEISSKEAGAMLGLTAQRVGQMVKAGPLRGRRVGRTLWVDRGSVLTEAERRRRIRSAS
ncbi:hypothetical protein [Phycicoccus sp.]|uniref:hypothetical protein n=1 Tax=Phycicoccus sp. TaxID=1902410 RepID=UPI002D0005D9|nr:hypothetical protein [Phycicoccus sp.]HMM96706.1 hypothetical protein [Phycicoccus sp.]